MAIPQNSPHKSILHPLSRDKVSQSYPKATTFDTFQQIIPILIMSAMRCGSSSSASKKAAEGKRFGGTCRFANTSFTVADGFQVDLHRNKLKAMTHDSYRSRQRQPATAVAVIPASLTRESTIKHSGCKSLLKSYRPEMKLEKMSIDLSWLGNSRIPKFVPFEWQLKAAKCYPWLRDLTPLPNTGCTATEDVNGLRTIAALRLCGARDPSPLGSLMMRSRKSLTPNKRAPYMGTRNEGHSHPTGSGACIYNLESTTRCEYAIGTSLARSGEVPLTIRVTCNVILRIEEGHTLALNCSRLSSGCLTGGRISTFARLPTGWPLSLVSKRAAHHCLKLPQLFCFDGPEAIAETSSIKLLQCCSIQNLGLHYTDFDCQDVREYLRGNTSVKRLRFHLDEEIHSDFPPLKIAAMQHLIPTEIETDTLCPSLETLELDRFEPLSNAPQRWKQFIQTDSPYNYRTVEAGPMSEIALFDQVSKLKKEKQNKYATGSNLRQSGPRANKARFQHSHRPNVDHLSRLSLTRLDIIKQQGSPRVFVGLQSWAIGKWYKRSSKKRRDDSTASRAHNI
ncbi:hypothetical protein C8J56DRAFT_900819 [Mycena floridula]|nr:hypothetical protein C8J56DRAFT_900819 [Mycena floridula]